MKYTLLSLLPVLLTACASTGQPEIMQPAASVAPTREAQLADATAQELAHIARFAPERVDRILPELRALAMALIEEGERDMPETVETEHFAPEPAPMPRQASVTTEIAPPPADMMLAPSLHHGIHLASYRQVDNARDGWLELQARFPAVLAHRSARLEETRIAERGVFLRLKAGPFDTEQDARTACASIAAGGSYCMTGDYSGQDIAVGSDSEH